MKLLRIPAVFAALGLAVTAFAAPINGVITFDGKATLNPNSIGTATQITGISGFVVKSSGGDFAGILASTPVTTTVAALNPWNFAGGAFNGLWSVGGFTLNLTSSAINTQNATALSVDGAGVVSGPVGYDPTPGTWYFTTQPGAVGGMFTFSAATTVPDGGTTALLLGLGLTGMALLARARRLIG